jgi:hypothetical protein
VKTLFGRGDGPSAGAWFQGADFSHQIKSWRVQSILRLTAQPRLVEITTRLIFSERTLREIYLPRFEQQLTRGWQFYDCL